MRHTPNLSLEKRLAAQRIAQDLLERVSTLTDLGLGYLALERSTPSLSSGELQRLRLATQLGSQLFGVIYVLDEPSAGLHPADAEALFEALQRLKAAGNSLFVVEHDVQTMRRADWLVDVGPAAGERGGQVLYSGPPAGLAEVAQSQTRAYLFPEQAPARRTPRPPRGWLRLEGISRNNLKELDAEFPLGCFTAVTGVSGSGKSSLVSQALLELVGAHLGKASASDEAPELDLADDAPVSSGGRVVAGMEQIKRLVQVDQNPSVVPRVPISRPTPGCSIRCASCSPPPTRPGSGASTPGSFPSTWPRAVARPVRARALSASSCCSCPACSPRARPAMARATTPRPWP